MADYGDGMVRNRRPLTFKKYFVSYRLILSLFCVMLCQLLYFLLLWGTF